MAYQQTSFNCARGSFNGSVSAYAPSFNLYVSPDTVDTVFGPDYFPPYFGFDSDQIKVNDFVLMKVSDGGGLFVVTNANPITLLGF